MNGDDDGRKYTARDGASCLLLMGGIILVCLGLRVVLGW